jgi:hypothetical protein
MTSEQRDRKRKADRDRMRTIKAAARGELPKLAPVEEHRIKVALSAEKERAAALLKDLSTYQTALDTIAAVTASPLPVLKRFELKSGLREATAVAMLSDVHADERVSVGETPFPNKYDMGIADRSVSRFFAGLRWKLDLYRNAFRIPNVVLWLGGDLSTGHIHAENIENTAATPIEMVLWWMPRLIVGIDSLLADPDLENIYIPCSRGNHGRNTIKPYRALGAVHSYEWLLYQLLGAHYAGEKRVRFLADKSAHQYVRVYDKVLHFHHGDETNYQGGVGGITIPLNKASAAWDLARRSDYHHFGHWHQYSPGGRIITNGSVIGFNAYAMSIKATPEPPQQAFYLLDSKRGKTCNSPIWVRASSDMPTEAEIAEVTGTTGASGVAA